MTWTRFARRNHAPLSVRLLQDAQQAPYFGQVTGLPTGLRSHVWINDSIYIPTGEQQALKDAADRQIDGEWSYIEEFSKRCRQALDGLGTAASEFALDVGSDRVSALQTWLDAYKRAMAFVPIFRIIDRALADRVTSEEASTYLDEAGIGGTAESHERTELQKLAEALRAAGDRSATSPMAYSLLGEHAERYAWLRLRWYLGNPFTVEDFRDRVAALLQLPPQPPAAPLPQSEVRTPASPRMRLLAELAHLRTLRAEMINEAIWRVRPRLVEIAAELGLSYIDFVYLYPEEAISAVETGTVDPARSRARQVSFASVLIDGVYTDAAGKGEVDIVTAQLALEPTAVPRRAGGRAAQIQGVTASSGQATGPVRIVNSDADAEQLLAGEILVTTMTYPSMVAAMQRAAAIVTDDGGLLSHAAVTARELGKPCVIDTGNATAVLRTGDIVDVDADAGKIQTLSSTSEPKESV